MAGFSEADASATEDIERVAALLGGPRVLRRRIRTALDAHEMLLQGLPGKALSRLVEGLTALRMDSSLEKALGLSLRTFQRRREAPAMPLSTEQSGRVWRFAGILAKATAVFGTQAEAEAWLERPAIGLNRRRPIELLETPAGIELVETYLTQIEYGVYV